MRLSAPFAKGGGVGVAERGIWSRGGVVVSRPISAGLLRRLCALRHHGGGADPLPALGLFLPLARLFVRPSRSLLVLSLGSLQGGYFNAAHLYLTHVEGPRARKSSYKLNFSEEVLFCGQPLPDFVIRSYCNLLG